MSADLVNTTPYAALAVPMIEPSGREVVVVIVKASFAIRADGRASLSDEQVPVRVSEVPHDLERPWSSLRYPSDLCPIKHGTDIVVVGEAVSRRPVPVMDVVVRARELTAPLRAHGPRVFYKGLFQIAIGEAAPCERVPLVYELAYGGATADLGRLEPRNPVGRGVARNPAELVDTLAPQIEHPAHPITTAADRPAPVGFGALAAHWSPRRERAGTFDDRWREERMPLLPADFDPRHYNVAHPSLTLDVPLVPGDPIAALGLTRDGPFSFEVPALRAVFWARFDRGEPVRMRPTLDTLLLEPGERRVEMVARQAFPVGRGYRVLRELGVDLDEA
ncbi:DUF2169 domain-containing protein [Sorangium sp. So ce136]|uniref:DUF2169 family type VI secretion system accessory protein n=1 Tax=Sorangium sp. So ce136 TaxID=3133284 RepID=UPI003EFE5750